MKYFIRKRLREEISASEARTDTDAVQTLIDGKRNVAFCCFLDDSKIKFLKQNNLNYINVPLNDYKAYIVYRNGAKKQAQELLSIANKYGGYLRHDATEEDSRRIGELLEYRKEDIDAYINRTGEYKQK